MAANLVSNPGFEQGAGDGWPELWAADRNVFSLVTDSPRTGTYCLRFENHDATRYVLCTAPLSLERGKRYELEAWVRTENVEGEDSGAAICIEWYGENKTFLGGAYPGGVKATNAEWTRVHGTTRPVPDEAIYTHVVCYVRKGMTGVAYWDDVSVKRFFPPLVAGMATDAYRNTVSGGTIRIKTGLYLDDSGLAPELVSARLILSDTQGRAVLTVAATTVANDEALFILDSDRLEPGAYSACCTVRSKDGRFEGTASCNLTKVEEPASRKAYIDSHGRLILDGEPFFPLGTYWSGVSEKHLDIYAKSAFNCLMPYGSPNLEQLDSCHKRGLKVIYSIKDYYAGTRWSPKHIRSTDDERPAVEKKVAEVGGHPAIMAWYINDELPLSMLDRLSARQRLMEQLDPTRPTWVVLYQVGDVRSYLPSFDVIGTDPYPIPQRPAKAALKYARMTHEATFGFRAVWMVPQIFNWAAYRKTPEEKAKCRAPTLLEMRSMSWQCIAGGATGLVFYSWMDLWRLDALDPFEDRWRDVCLLAAEIKRFIPVLLSVDAPVRPGQVECADDVAWRLFAMGGDTYLIAVNSETEPAEAVFRFSAGVQVCATELGESQASASGPEVKVMFAPLEPKVIRLRFGTR